MQGRKTPQSTDSPPNKTWQICLSFGLTVGIAVYLLGFLFGAWLDDTWGTKPLFTIIGALIAIASSFYRLIHDFMVLDKWQKEHKGKKQ